MEEKDKGGRPRYREDAKERRNYMIYNSTHDGLAELAKILNLPSRSEVIHYLTEEKLKELKTPGSCLASHSAA